MEIISAEDPSRIGEDPLPQITNIPEIDLDVGDYLQRADPPVAAQQEHGVASVEKASGLNSIQQSQT